MSKDKVAIIHVDEQRTEGPGGRLLRPIAFGCFGITLLGLGIHHYWLRPDPGAVARAYVVSAGIEVAPDVAPAWFDESPPPVPKYPVDESRSDEWTDVIRMMFLFDINETLLRALWKPGSGLTSLLGSNAPTDFSVFDSPDGSPFPRYRYPASVSMPDGLTTNQFGFRGPEIALDKSVGTIRIGFAGASNTVDAHYLGWSWPELVGNWLQLWADAHGYDVRFEVINAAREALTSQDIRRIAIYELLPLDLDYLVYYEGQNQFSAQSMLRQVAIEGEFTVGKPPADLLMDLRAADERGQHWLDPLCRHAESARRLRQIVGVYDELAEPTKPAQKLRNPEVLDKGGVDLTRAHEVMEFGAIIPDLDAILAASRERGARMLMCTFDRVVFDGMRTHLTSGHSLHMQINRDYWPLSYDTLKRMNDLQNAYFTAWAAANDVALIDVAARMPQAPTLFTDMIHAKELGSRLRGWCFFTEVVARIADDIENGRVPTMHREPLERHPHIHPPRRITAEELDK